MDENDKKNIPTPIFAVDLQTPLIPLDEDDAENQRIYMPPIPVEQTNSPNLLRLYINTFLSATFAESFVYHLDVIKTRMQLENEEIRKLGTRALSMKQTMMSIVRDEGIRNLYGGFSAMTIRNAFFNSMRVVLYDAIREQLVYVNEENREVLTVTRSFIAGSIAGCIAQTIANPFDILKVRMQMEGRRQFLGQPARVHNIFQGFQDIYIHGGLLSMWKGVGASCARACLVTAGEVSSYDLSKRNLRYYFDLNEGILLQLLSSLSSGLVSSILSNPADVVKSHVMNQPIDKNGEGLFYKNSLDCFYKVVKNDGVLAMFKGIIPCWLRFGPWSVLFWLSLEQLRKWEGQTGF